MKTLTLELSDEVYERAERRSAELGRTLEQELAMHVESLGNGADEQALIAARRRMQELFSTIKGFRLSPKIPREELYERGSLR